MNFYETPDLGLTSALLTIGNEIKGSHMQDSKMIFTFEYSKHLLDQVGLYFGSGLEVNAKSYYYNLRDLKKVIYENAK